MVLLGREDLGSSVGQGVARSGEGLALLREDASKTKVNHLDSGIVRATSEEKILGEGEREREREREGGRERGREGERKRGREGERERGREGERETKTKGEVKILYLYHTSGLRSLWTTFFWCMKVTADTSC